MSARFYQIIFKFANGELKTDELKPVFNLALDWFRFAGNCWIVWSTSSPEIWYKRLRAHIADDDSMFIVALDVSERQGWMSKAFWDWLNQDRSDDKQTDSQ